MADARGLGSLLLGSQVSFLAAAAAWWGKEGDTRQSPLLKAVFFAFIEEICLRAPQIDNLGATISVLLLDGALLAVVGVGDAGAPADHAAPLVGAVVAFVTDAHQGAGTHVGVTDHTLAVTFLTQSSDGCKRNATASERRLWSRGAAGAGRRGEDSGARGRARLSSDFRLNPGARPRARPRTRPQHGRPAAHSAGHALARSCDSPRPSRRETGSSEAASPG